MKKDDNAPDEKTPGTIDEYIALFAPDMRERLSAMRETIRKAAPGASERMSWRMPTFYQNGNLVHFACFTGHIGFYPGANGVEMFKDRLSGYKTSKGAIQFPHKNPLPLELVDEIVRFRVSENTDGGGD